MSTNSECIVGSAGPRSLRPWPLFDAAQTRALEQQHQASNHTASLMQVAGLAVARLVLATAPHARRIWIACGPGNNGGDGMEAAMHLLRWGKQPIVSCIHGSGANPPDAQRAQIAAQAAGVEFVSGIPPQFDVCVDALFGIGTSRPIQGVYAAWIDAMNRSEGTRLAVDIPSGLQSDTGVAGSVQVRASHTLSLLTLKPGLFTGHGRDVCGEIWFNDLGIRPASAPSALLSAAGTVMDRPHASHKGSFGDVCVIGGAAGMSGAALLAGRSALYGGAGRVFVCPLDSHALALDPTAPELMFRNLDDLDLSPMTAVVGCGAGSALAGKLERIAKESGRLVLDADALNHMAQQPEFHSQVAARAPGTTVMTPHPLEAARLLGCRAADVQANRLLAAQKLCTQYQCVVVLKGSGTVVCGPGETPRINPTGNGKLASAGTGDVLAGLIGARLAAGQSALDAASAAVYQHGAAADHWLGTVLSASALSHWD